MLLTSKMLTFMHPSMFLSYAGCVSAYKWPELTAALYLFCFVILVAENILLIPDDVDMQDSTFLKSFHKACCTVLYLFEGKSLCKSHH